MFKFKDTQNIIMRTGDMLGLQEFSLDTCRVTDSMEKMHGKPILDFIILRDRHTIITAGRDREIGIWNIARKLEINKLDDHESAVTCLTVSKDE